MRNPPIILLALGAALVLGGCSAGESDGGGGVGEAAADSGAADSGIGEQSPEEILTAAGEAFQGASSVTIKGTLGSDGNTTTVDGQITRQGDIQISVTSNGIGMEAITLGDKTWLRSPDTWTQANPNIAEVIADRWVLVTPEVESMGVTQGIGGFGDMDALGEIFLAGEGQLEKVDGETVGGVPTVGLRDADNGTLHIATQGEPFPLLVTPPEGEDQSQRFEFSGYNEQPSISAPENAIDDLTGLLTEHATSGTG